MFFRRQQHEHVASPDAMAVNMTYSQPQPPGWIADLNARNAIIQVLHSTGWDVYEREAYPRFFT